jgi:hypothetical protein
MTLEQSRNALLQLRQVQQQSGKKLFEVLKSIFAELELDKVPGRLVL